MSTPVLDPIAREGATHALREHAHQRHAAYPQYQGYYDQWRLFVVTQRVTYKGGAVFEPGRIVLASPDVTLLPGMPATRTAYDPVTGHNCAVPHEFIQEIQEVRP